MRAKELKKQLRQHYLALRTKRSSNILDHLLPHFARTDGYVLSFASFGSEISTKELNAYLLDQKRLALPRVEGNLLKAYAVDENSTLILSELGVLEPDPTKCQQLAADQLVLIIVPGLAFDTDHYRLGYGKGYYDRFLSGGIPTVGIGYKEQLSPSPLPREPHDIPLDHLCLV